MTGRVLRATLGRVLLQLRHDPRTVALVFAVPLVLMTLIYYMFAANAATVDSILLVMLSLFPFTIMFAVTSVAMLRERTSGTLERLMTTQCGKLDLVFGYGLSFGIVAALQGAVTTGFGYLVLGMRVAGPVWLVVVITILSAVLGVGLGLLGSAFARTEFQAVQLIPLAIIPQLLLCGLFVPREQMATWLHVVSDLLPLSYVVDAVNQVGAHDGFTGWLWRDLAVLAGCVLAALGLGAATLRRRTE